MTDRMRYYPQAIAPCGRKRQHAVQVYPVSQLVDVAALCTTTYRCSTPNTDLESLVSDAKARNVYFTAAQVSKAMKTWRKNKAAAKVC